MTVLLLPSWNILQSNPLMYHSIPFCKVSPHVCIPRLGTESLHTPQPHQQPTYIMPKVPTTKPLSLLRLLNQHDVWGPPQSGPVAEHVRGHLVGTFGQCSHCGDLGMQGLNVCSEHGHTLCDGCANFLQPHVAVQETGDTNACSHMCSFDEVEAPVDISPPFLELRGKLVKQINDAHTGCFREPLRPVHMHPRKITRALKRCRHLSTRKSLLNACWAFFLVENIFLRQCETGAVEASGLVDEDVPDSDEVDDC